MTWRTVAIVGYVVGALVFVAACWAWGTAAGNLLADVVSYRSTTRGTG